MQVAYTNAQNSNYFSHCVAIFFSVFHILFAEPFSVFLLNAKNAQRWNQTAQMLRLEWNWNETMSKLSFKWRSICIKHSESI